MISLLLGLAMAGPVDEAERSVHNFRLGQGLMIAGASVGLLGSAFIDYDAPAPLPFAIAGTGIGTVAVGITLASLAPISAHRRMGDHGVHGHGKWSWLGLGVSAAAPVLMASGLVLMPLTNDYPATSILWLGGLLTGVVGQHIVQRQMISEVTTAYDLEDRKRANCRVSLTTLYCQL